MSGGCLERSGDRKPTVSATVDTTVTLSQMPNVDMRGVVRSAFIVPSALGKQLPAYRLTLRGDRSRHDECCGLGSITSRFAAILARRASQHRECWPERDYCNGRDFDLTFMSGKLPPRASTT